MIDHFCFDVKILEIIVQELVWSYTKMYFCLQFLGTNLVISWT